MHKFINKKPAQYVYVFIVLLGFVGLLYNCSSDPKEPLSLSESYSDSTFLTLDNYVGSDACMPCHAQKFEGFMQTGMGRSFGKATPLRSNAYEKPINVVYDTINDFYYEPIWSDTQLYIKEFRIFNEDTLYSRIEKVDYIIGSGHHTNSHLMSRNGFLYQMPITYYTQQGIWDLAPGYRDHNARFTRRIEMECMSCHNAYPEASDSAFHLYNSIPLGISCERCHGPGAEHVEKMLQGAYDSGQPKYIVNPVNLSWELQVDVCQRCHLQGNIVLEPNKQFSDFKPGMALSEVFTVFMPHYKEGKEFRMAAHAERFQMSECFIQQESLDFTCISCHDPHHSVRKTNHRKFNNTCAGCHTAESACKASHAAVTVAQNNCVACHMPSSSAVDIPHVSVHDHWITTPQKRTLASNRNDREPQSLYAVNNPNPELHTLFAAYVSYFEKFDRNLLYLTKARELYNQLDNSDYSLSLKIYFHYTANEFEKIPPLLKNRIDSLQADAWTWYRIAKAFENTGDYKQAYTYLLKATELKPKFAPFWIDRIIVEIDLKKWNQALAHIAQVLEWNACESRALAQLARLYMLKEDVRNAGIAAQRSLRCDPDNRVALEILTHLSQQSGVVPPLLKYHLERSNP